MRLHVQRCAGSGGPSHGAAAFPPAPGASASTVFLSGRRKAGDLIGAVAEKVFLHLLGEILAGLRVGQAEAVFRLISMVCCLTHCCQCFLGNAL